MEDSKWEMRSLASVDDSILARQDMAEDNNNQYVTKIGTDGGIEQVRVDTSLSDPAVESLTPNFFGRPLESMIDSTRHTCQSLYC